MSIDVAGLQSWPDPGTVDTSAALLKSGGASFASAIDQAHTAWLAVPKYYETPDAAELYSALDPAVEAAQQVRTGTATIDTALTTFATAVKELVTERDALLRKAHAADLEPCPADPAAFEKQNAAHTALQQEVDDLVAKFLAAVANCAESIASLNDDGTQGKPSDPNASFGLSQAVAGIQGHLESLKVLTIKFRKQLVIRAFGVDFHLAWFGGKKVRVRFYDSGGRYEPTPKPKKPSADPATGAGDEALPLKEGESAASEASALEEAMKEYGGKTGAGLRDQLLGPSMGHYRTPTELKPADIDGNFGIGVAETNTSKVGVSGLGKFGGRALAAVGLALTYHDEYESAQKKLAEEHPELSVAQRQEKAAEKAFVRGSGEFMATAVAGAAIGSVLPVGGTAVGFVVGAAVGLATTYIKWDGESLNDHIGDWSEKGAGAVRSLFHW